MVGELWSSVIAEVFSMTRKQGCRWEWEGRKQGWDSHPGQQWANCGPSLATAYLCTACKLRMAFVFMLFFSHSVVSNSLWPHGMQHARHPCCSPSPRACSDSCPLSWWCHPTISSSVIPFSSCLQSFQASGSFPMKSALRISWPKHWSFNFSLSPSNEYSGSVSFKVDWFIFITNEKKQENNILWYKRILWN